MISNGYCWFMTVHYYAKLWLYLMFENWAWFGLMVGNGQWRFKLPTMNVTHVVEHHHHLPLSTRIINHHEQEIDTFQPLLSTITWVNSMVLHHPPGCQDPGTIHQVTQRCCTRSPACCGCTWPWSNAGAATSWRRMARGHAGLRGSGANGGWSLTDAAWSAGFVRN